MVAITLPAAACTIVSAYQEAGPDFKVRVEDRGHPVAGLKLHTQEYSAITDENGIAIFRGVKPGHYTLEADHDVSIGGGGVSNRESEWAHRCNR